MDVPIYGYAIIVVIIDIILLEEIMMNVTFKEMALDNPFETDRPNNI